MSVHPYIYIWMITNTQQAQTRENACLHGRRKSAPGSSVTPTRGRPWGCPSCHGLRFGRYFARTTPQHICLLLYHKVRTLLIWLPVCLLPGSCCTAPSSCCYHRIRTPCSCSNSLVYPSPKSVWHAASNFDDVCASFSHSRQKMSSWRATYTMAFLRRNRSIHFVCEGECCVHG